MSLATVNSSHLPAGAANSKEKTLKNGKGEAHNVSTNNNYYLKKKTEVIFRY